MKQLRTFAALQLLVFTSAIQAAAADIGTLGASVSLDGKNLNLHWNSSPGQVQQIQISADLVHWTNLPPVFLSPFASSAWSDDGSFTGGVFNSAQPRFYRLLQSSATSGSAGVPFTFLPPNTGTSFSWNFGDGTTSTSNQPSHTFSGDGLYVITSVVTDANGSHTNTAALPVETAAQILLTPQVL